MMTISKRLSAIASRLFGFLFPQSCVCCGRRLLDQEQHVCTMCVALWPRTVLGDDHRDNIFARRFWGVVGLVNGTTVFCYVPDSGFAKVVHAMKYGNNQSLCWFMGRMIMSSPQAANLLADADVLVPVPINRQRLLRRGYNQSELLCKGISSVTGLPVITTALRRIRFVESQTLLTHQQRRENVRGAFALGDTSAIEGRHIVIVDDVVTTGSTTLECIFVLKDVPGIKISILALSWTGGHWNE